MESQNAIPQLGQVAPADADATRCTICHGTHHGDDAVCGRCRPILDDVERARRRTPFVVVGPSAFPPHQERVLSGDDALWRAKLSAKALAQAGYAGLHVEDERTGQRWAVTA